MPYATNRENQIIQRKQDAAIIRHSSQAMTQSTREGLLP
jgi:hypothetical protein